MTDDFAETRASIQHDVRVVVGQLVYLKLAHDGGGGAGKLAEKIFRRVGGAFESMTDEQAWRLTIELIIAAVDRDLRVSTGVTSACALYVRREVLGERWLDVAARAKCSIGEAKGIVAAATANLYAYIIVRKITRAYDMSAAA